MFGINPLMMTPVGGGAAPLPQEVFATTLYTGNDTARNISTSIDIAGFGGMVWLKSRGSDGGNMLVDSVRGARYSVVANTANPQDDSFGAFDVTNFLSDGFSLGPSYNGVTNTSGVTFASWSFRRAPKFFDVVTWTGNGTAGRQIAHSLGVAPGMVIVKKTSGASGWVGRHIAAAGKYCFLNVTDAFAPDGGYFFGNGSSDVAPTASNFTVSDVGEVNASGEAYVAYLFAHDPDPSGIVQCGVHAGGETVNLGWRPQFLIRKAVSDGPWYMLDTARGWGSGADAYLRANGSNAEASADFSSLTSTGFTDVVDAGSPSLSFIYLAIREPI